MNIEALKDVVVKCKKLTKDKSTEGLNEVVDAIETARQSTNTKEIRNILDSMYQSTDVVKKFSLQVEKVIGISSKTVMLLGGDQDEDTFTELRSALAYLSTSGDTIKKANDMCGSCLEAASKGEGLSSFVRDLDELMESLHESFAGLAKVGGGFAKASGGLMALKSVLHVN